MALWYTTVLFAFLNSWMSQCLSAGQCQQDWSSFNNSCFKYYSKTKSWTNAESQCAQNNGHLTSIMSSAENGHVKSLLSGTIWAWIGFHDTTTEDTFEWSDGSSVTYTNWMTGQPNDFRSQDCASIGVGSGQWYDFGCGTPRSFVCRKAPSSTSTTPTSIAKPPTTHASTTQTTTAAATTQLVTTHATTQRTIQATTTQAATTQTATTQAATTQATTTQTATTQAATTQTATTQAATTQAATTQATTTTTPVLLTTQAATTDESTTPTPAMQVTTHQLTTSEASTMPSTTTASTTTKSTTTQVSTTNSPTTTTTTTTTTHSPSPTAPTTDSPTTQTPPTTHAPSSTAPTTKAPPTAGTTTKSVVPTSQTTKAAASLRSTAESQPPQSPTIIQTTNLESRSPVTSQSPRAQLTTTVASPMMKASNTPTTNSPAEPTKLELTASDSTNYTVIYASIGAGLGLLFVVVVLVVVLIKRRGKKYAFGEDKHALRGSTRSTQGLVSSVLYCPAEEVCRIDRPQSHKSSVNERTRPPLTGVVVYNPEYHAINFRQKDHHITTTVQKEQSSEKGSSRGRETQRSNSIVESEQYEEPIRVNSVTAGNTGRVEPIYCEPGNTEESLYGQLQQWKLPNIDRKTVQTVKELGSGEFGIVYKAVWNKGQQHSQIVAVKSLHASDKSSHVKFLREAFIMGQFKHKNVVTLHGIVVSGKPMMIVLEYMEKGDLKEFLFNFRPSDNTSYLPANTADRLLRMSREIAAGMKYLESKSFVHRDLAARNIMLDSDENCKIGDFGLARDLADENYYITSGGKIPVRWTAPEALDYRKYSTASDVWSYGVVLYEIWSIGERPYGVMGNKELAGLVATGKRLPPPPGCPRPIYHLMISCWHPDYHRRMSFRRVVSYLSGENWSLLTNKQDEESIVGHLGDELVVSKRMYRDLQKTYIGMH